MRQGICTILPDLTLHPEFSAHLVQSLEREDLAGANVMDLLFNNHFGSDQLQQIETALYSILEQDAFMYDFNCHALPTEMTYTAGENRKILELHWNPVLDDDQCICRIMLVVRDITQMRQLQQQAQQQQRELTITGQILATGALRFLDFIQGSGHLIEKNRATVELAETPDTLAPEELSLLYRNLHTIKGNARTLGFLAMTDRVHEAEQVLQGLRDGVLHPVKEELLRDLSEVTEELATYEAIYNQKLKGFVASPAFEPDCIAIKRTELDSIQDAISLGADLESVLAMIRKLQMCSVQEMVKSMLSTLPAIAEDVDKPVPETRIQCEGFWIAPACQSLLADAFMHLLRNSLSHGIETPEERLASAKPAEGCIQVKMCTAEDRYQLHISDDGRGLALDKIASKAHGLGLLPADREASPQEIAAVIFSSGFSTADSISMTSGRGVGMDAVRAILGDLGIEIDIVLLNEKSPGYRDFYWQLTFPERTVTQ
jgi:two-component system chemotaxis sensor kinase CheA